MTTDRPRSTCLWLAVITSLFNATVIAEDKTLLAQGVGADSPAELGLPVTDSELESLRGGFVDADGLRFAFSFDRVTRLNGEALAEVSVVTPVFSLADGGAGTSFTSVSQQFDSLQGLAGFSLNTGSLEAGGMPTLLQNALDNQNIENLTLINLDIIGTDTLRGTMVHNLIESTSVSALNP